jgi:hypothetical protein
MDETSIPPALLEAVKVLWRIPPPGPDNLLSAPPFVRLRETCNSLYTKSKDTHGFGLANALRALGLPCGLAPSNTPFALTEEVAAAKLDEAFRQTHGMRVYLCPLDEADYLPELDFGPNSIRTFTTAELEELVNFPQLKRINSNWTFDAQRFSWFHWLAVKEPYPFSREPGARAVPWLSMPVDLNRDWGQIEPHRGRFPDAVEDALFAILLAPWEEWVRVPDHDWCGFRVPWVYKVDDDIFVRPAQPPSADTLSSVPDFFIDPDGTEVEVERPIRWPLNSNAGAGTSAWLNDAAWSAATRARQSPLFETPVAHFFVRAFLSGPLDEFLAHIFTIEAALGLWKEPKIPGLKKQPSATKRMVARVSALLGERAGEDYRRVFKHRSEFVHGRKMKALPGKERIVARRLARQVINGLMNAALASPEPRSREDYLSELLNRGLT